MKKQLYTQKELFGLVSLKMIYDLIKLLSLRLLT